MEHFGKRIRVTRKTHKLKQSEFRMNYFLPAFSIVALTLFVGGCATQLESSADKVQVVTVSQKEQLCKSLGIVSTEQRVGPNKPSNAMNKALNAVAKRGGNGIFIVSSNLDWAEGASVTAEALQCRF
jgi:hypothetical protein